MDNFLAGRAAMEGKGATGDIGGGIQSLGKSVGPQSVTVVKGEVEGEQPRVELLMEKGVVRRIRISCPCGKCTELECEY